MSANGISTLANKELRQKAKLDLAATNRAADGNTRATYDITQLPTQYSGNDIIDNPNSGGLIEGRPWIAVSYSVSPASASVNEGSSLTFNVTTAGVANGTTLYWTVANTTTDSADFSAVSGSFTITSNAGSFTVTAISDLITEGTETFTVQVRTGSTSGTVVATSASTTVNDTSTSPDNISGLRFWIDTATTSTLNSGTYTDGDVLTSWTEKKQAAAYVNPAANRRATIQSGAGDLQNGYPVVRFAASGADWDQARWNSVSGLANATGCTMVCLIKFTPSVLSQNHIIRIGNASSTYSSYLTYNTTSGQFLVGAPTGYANIDNTVDLDGTWKIITARYDSTAAAASRVTFRWAKTARTVTNAATAPSGALDATAGSNIEVGFFCSGDLGEMMVYNTALSDADIILLENYLSSKWGV